MPHPIETSFINSFKSGFESAFQQSQSLFRPYVEEGRQSAEFDYEDRIGLAEDMREANTRYGDNPMTEISHDRRRFHVKDWENGKAIDEKDLVRVASDPTNPYTQALVASANRKYDDNVIATAFGKAYTDKTGSTEVSFVGTTSGKVTIGALSNGQGYATADGLTAVTAGNYEGIDIAVNYTGTTPANAGLNLAKLKAVRSWFETLAEGYVTENTIIPMFISRRQAEDLLAIDEVINSDYATRKALADGTVTTFMGFRFIRCNRLDLTSNNRSCIAMLPRALKMKMSQDINADMWRLPHKKNIPYIYIKMGMGGSRMWGECLARVRCYEA